MQRNYKIKAITLFHNIIVLHIDSKNTSFYKKSVVGSKGQILVVKYYEHNKILDDHGLLLISYRNTISKLKWKV